MLKNIAPGECYSEDYKRFQLNGHNARDSKSQNHLVVLKVLRILLNNSRSVLINESVSNLWENF